ncbi:putative Branched-chain amino acid aminotransferase [Burkholderia multivorans]|uniref:Branched-chain amino acid aminotransferase n=1 Tax=Burkholderia multivorans TaxID=87883 RepID=A0ABD7LCE9_9BURK|nr:putative Branched-chain amino acid aminotransferase [Burkholderia multivorans]
MRYGLSVFEGMRAYLTHDGRLQPFRMGAHLERLRQSAHAHAAGPQHRPDPGDRRAPGRGERRTRGLLHPAEHPRDRSGRHGFDARVGADGRRQAPWGARNGLPRISRRRSRSRAGARRGTMCFRRRRSAFGRADGRYCAQPPPACRHRPSHRIFLEARSGGSGNDCFDASALRRSDDQACRRSCDCNRRPVEPDVTLIAERIQRQKSIRAILARGDWLTARQINLLQAAPPSNEVQPASEWKRRGDIFSVFFGGKNTLLATSSMRVANHYRSSRRSSMR